MQRMGEEEIESLSMEMASAQLGRGRDNRSGVQRAGCAEQQQASRVQPAAWTTHAG